MILRNVLAVVIMYGNLGAADYPPDWVTDGILAVESSSYRQAGVVVYVNKAIGAHGERGPFQMTRAAFNVVQEGNEKFEHLQDPVFAEYKYILYMRWLCHWSDNWDARVRMWNVGPGAYAKRLGTTYLKKVKNEAAKIPKTR